MKKTGIITLLVLILVIAFSVSAFASTMAINKPSITAVGNNAQCTAKVTFWGQSINATLELFDGSTLVASWSKTGTSNVSFSETEPFISGHTYTLTLSGTVDGTPFTPTSVTKTLW